MASFRQNLATAITLLSFVMPCAAQTPGPDDAARSQAGILLLAHGGSEDWNSEVLRLANQVDQRFPTEVAFGMASKRTIQDGVKRLIHRGVKQIVAVPLFISSHSSVITATQYLLGLRAEAPPELVRYAQMDHGHGAGHTIDKTLEADKPVRSEVPIRMTAALDRHPLVADILLSRGHAVSREPEREALIIVAHGPVSEEENLEWLEDMNAIADRMRQVSDFREVECLTLRDDAPEPIRSQATASLRSAVERAGTQAHRVLLVPLLLSYGGIEKGIRQRLEGLNYSMSSQGLLPDDRLVRWVLLTMDDSRRKQ